MECYNCSNENIVGVVLGEIVEWNLKNGCVGKLDWHCSQVYYLPSNWINKGFKNYFLRYPSL